LECGILILAGTAQAKQQEKRRVVEKHVTHKEEQQTSKMVLTYITNEDETVPWEKGTAAMEKWPHCSQLDGSSKRFFVNTVHEKLSVCLSIIWGV
jgi:hypothetical protein